MGIPITCVFIHELSTCQLFDAVSQTVLELSSYWAMFISHFNLNDQWIARTQSTTNKNCAFELPTFGVIVGVSLTVVQWRGLTLEEPPS